MSLPRRCLIVGSGIGGLALGALLAKAGTNVTILEANPHALGGYAQSISQGKFEFTAGPRYLWNFGPDQPGRRFLQYLKIADQVPMVTLDPNALDHVYIGDNNPVHVPIGWKKYEEFLCDQFPSETSGIKKFFSLCQDIFELVRYAERKGLMFGSRHLAMLRYGMRYPKRLTTLAKLGAKKRWTLRKAFDFYRLSPRLCSVLFGHGLIFALPEEELSLFSYAAATLYYHQGAHYPKNDMKSLIQALADVIQRAGGQIIQNASVNRIVLEKEKINYIETSVGDRHEADLYICNIDPAAFLGMVTCGSTPNSKLSTYEYSESLTSLFIGLKSHNSLTNRFGPWNLWYRESDRRFPDLFRTHAFSPPKMLYANSPSLLMERRENPTLTVFVPSQIHQFKDASAKQRHVDAILQLLDDRFAPGVRDDIECCVAHTPVEKKLIFKAPFGNVYGRRMTPGEVFRSMPDQIGISNLRFVGSVIASPGIAPIIQHACQVFDQISQSTHLTDQLYHS